jgi:uncharacterized protein (DUF3820 family)
MERSPARTLETAVRLFTGGELGDKAHTALGDTAILPNVLEGMAQQLDPSGTWRWNGSEPSTLETFQEVSQPPHEIDRAGKFTIQDGRVLFNFGKYKGEPADRLDYLEWMLKQDFPPDTKGVAARLLEGREAEIVRRVTAER